MTTPLNTPGTGIRAIDSYMVAILGDANAFELMVDIPYQSFRRKNLTRYSGYSDAGPESRAFLVLCS